MGRPARSSVDLSAYIAGNSTLDGFRWRVGALSRPTQPQLTSLVLATTHRPRRRAGLRVERRGAPVLLGLRRVRRVAVAADGSPGLERELVLAVEAVARVGRRVAARFAGGDRLE